MILLYMRMLSVTCPNNAPDNSIQDELLEAFATDPLTLKGRYIYNMDCTVSVVDTIEITADERLQL